MNLVIGIDGILGSAIFERVEDRCGPTRGTFDLAMPHLDYPGRKPPTAAYLCAGTKGYAECEGNRKAFRADVDGNIRVARQLLREGSFVVFISTDGVEWGAHTAYARNRLLVEMALIMQPNVAIVRPAKFSKETVGPLADLCVEVGTDKKEGLHYWP